MKRILALACLPVLGVGLASTPSAATHICNEIHMFTGVSGVAGYDLGVGCTKSSTAEVNTWFGLSGSDFYIRPFVAASRTCNGTTPPTGPTVGTRKTGGRIDYINAAGKITKSQYIYWGLDSSNRYVGPRASVPAGASAVKISASVKGIDCVARARSITATVPA